MMPNNRCNVKLICFTRAAQHQRQIWSFFFNCLQNYLWLTPRFRRRRRKMNCGTPWQSHWFVSFDATHFRALHCTAQCTCRSQNHLAKLLNYAKWVQRWIRGQQKQQHDILAFPLNILTTTKVSLIAPRGALYASLPKLFPSFTF